MSISERVFSSSPSSPRRSIIRTSSRLRGRRGRGADLHFDSLVKAKNLKARLKRVSLSPGQALALLSQVAAALDAAHARGLVHGDVKPSNVLVATGAGRDGEDHVYLADFGLTRRLNEPAVDADGGQLVGTVGYVAPEQIRGEAVSAQADVYSLGCLLFECLTGDAPFRRGSDVAQLFAHLEEEPPAVTDSSPELPEAIDEVCSRALAKSPGGRYESCGSSSARRGGLSAWRAPGITFAACRRRGSAAGLCRVSRWASRNGQDAVRPQGETFASILHHVVRRMMVGREATGVAVGRGAVWVTNLGDGTVSWIDLRTGTVRTIAARGSPTAVAIARGSAVVADGSAHKLTTFDAATGLELSRAVERIGAMARSRSQAGGAESGLPIRLSGSSRGPITRSRSEARLTK